MESEGRRGIPFAPFSLECGSSSYRFPLAQATGCAAEAALPRAPRAARGACRRIDMRSWPRPAFAAVRPPTVRCSQRPVGSRLRRALPDRTGLKTCAYIARPVAHRSVSGLMSHVSCLPGTRNSEHRTCPSRLPGPDSHRVLYRCLETGRVPGPDFDLVVAWHQMIGRDLEAL
jgi:hypothetical protein